MLQVVFKVTNSELLEITLNLSQLDVALQTSYTFRIKPSSLQIHNALSMTFASGHVDFQLKHNLLHQPAPQEYQRHIFVLSIFLTTLGCNHQHHKCLQLLLLHNKCQYTALSHLRQSSQSALLSKRNKRPLNHPSLVVFELMTQLRPKMIFSLSYDVPSL